MGPDGNSLCSGSGGVANKPTSMSVHTWEKTKRVGRPRPSGHSGTWHIVTQPSGQSCLDWEEEKDSSWRDRKGVVEG